MTSGQKSREYPIDIIYARVDTSGMKTTDCSLCYRPATVRIYGKFRNGREAIDQRCADHAPDKPIGPVGGKEWAFFGTTNRLFRMEDIDRIRPGQ